jgi:hypothetical protein
MVLLQYPANSICVADERTHTRHDQKLIRPPCIQQRAQVRCGAPRIWTAERGPSPTDGRGFPECALARSLCGRVPN